MKKIDKLVIITIILILLIVSLSIWFLVSRKTEDKKSSTPPNRPNVYEMVVSINPSVKLVFEIDENCKEAFDICLSSSSKIVDAELINEDAKEIYKDVDIKGKNVYEAITKLVDVAKDNNIDVKDVKITSELQINSDALKNFIKTGSTNKIDVEIEVVNSKEESNIGPTGPTTTTTTTTFYCPSGVKNCTTNITSTSTTGITGDPKTTTTANSHKGYVNLNDNIEVTEVEPCGSYIQISSTCTNMTINDLILRYPMAINDLNELMNMTNAQNTDDVSVLYKSYPLSYKEYIPECGSAPTGDACNNKRYNGAYTSCNQYGLQMHYLTTKNSTYKSLFEYSKLEKYLNNQNIYYEARCGGGEYPTAKLTEELCNKYNLKCDRW